jgi:exosortase
LSITRQLPNRTAFRVPPVPAGIAALWLVVFLTCSYGWRFGDYYDYGWYVPPLAVLLFLGRWRELPEAPAAFPRWIPVAFLAAAAGWAAARLLIHTDPAWRLPIWTLAGIATAATFALVARAKGWAGCIALLPVLLFALSAVPLPSGVEKLLIGKMTDGVIEATALLLNLSGRPVTIWGDRMESLGEWVEVADGCSGIRSLQGFLMVGLFFGEWLRLPVLHRVVLMLLSLGAVLVVNVARALSLAWLRFEHGEAAAARWHDAAGGIAFVAGALAVWWLAGKLEPTRRRAAPAHPAPAHPGAPLSWRPVAVLLGLLASIEAATWAWMNPPRQGAEAVLALELPVPGSRLTLDSKLFDEIRPALRCNDGWLGTVGEDQGNRGLRAGWLAWDAQDAGSVLEAFKHKPEQCMGAIGWQLVRHHEARTHEWAGGKLTFDVTEFSDRTRPGGTLHVYKSVWISSPVAVTARGGIEGLGSSAKLRQLRLATAWNRFRPEHARVVMGVVSGEAAEADAWARFRDEVLAGLALRRNPGTGPQP